MYLLDTNTCIRYINGSSLTVLNRLNSVSAQDIAVCSIVKAELFFGAAKSGASTRTLARQQKFLNQFHSFPFDDPAATLYGAERARLAKLGTPIGPLDLLIACIALANTLTLVTHNTREFSRVAGLTLDDWELTP